MSLHWHPVSREGWKRSEPGPVTRHYLGRLPAPAVGAESPLLPI